MLFLFIFYVYIYIYAIFYQQKQETINALTGNPEIIVLMRIVANLSKLVAYKSMQNEIVCAEGNDSANILVVKTLVDSAVQLGCEWVSLLIGQNVLCIIKAVRAQTCTILTLIRILLSNNSLKFFHTQMKEIMSEESFQCTDSDLKQLSLQLRVINDALELKQALSDYSSQAGIHPCEWVRCNIMCANNDIPIKVKNYIINNTKPEVWCFNKSLEEDGSTQQDCSVSYCQA